MIHNAACSLADPEYKTIDLELVTRLEQTIA